MIDRLVRLGSAALLAWVALAGAASAQDQFNARSPTPETFNGGNSQPTGTQGVVGNPFCAPPHEIINGKDVTPLNWSCPTVQQPYVIPKSFTVARPGPVVPPGAANPCQPGGPGGYNFLDNPVGTALPAGCVRPAAKTAAKSPAKPTAKTITKTDSAYESAPPGYYLEPPAAPPGSYIQPDPKPGDYLEPDGTPGSYIDSTTRSGPGTVTQISPSGAIEVTPGTGNENNAAEPASATPYRPNNQALQGGVTGEQRQDIGAMQPQLPGNLFGLVPSGPSQTMSQAPAQAAPRSTARTTQPTTKKATTASNAKKPVATNTAGMTPAQAAQLMNAFIHMAGSSP